jgi:hypothetical protein
LPYYLLLIVSKRKVAIALTEVDYCPGSRPCGAICAHATLSIDGFRANHSLTWFQPVRHLRPHMDRLTPPITAEEIERLDQNLAASEYQ